MLPRIFTRENKIILFLFIFINSIKNIVMNFADAIFMTIRIIVFGFRTTSISTATNFTLQFIRPIFY